MDHLYFARILVLDYETYEWRKRCRGGSGIFSVGKSKAKLYEKANDLGITFKDVAGQEGAKQEVQEIVEFLKPKEIHRTWR